ncbi:MAG: hypothetical protein K940chlam9_01353 [Chlamydiae bacterium]|nr:hypothetical protein [Chlamydiota bacterium]
MKRNISGFLRAWKRRGDRKPLIIRGVRQVGKTYALQRFGEEEFPRYHYFNFEEDEELKKFFQKDLRPKRILSELEFHTKQPINPQTDLLIFDEVQESPRALTSLKYFRENMPELAICCAGSLLGIHLNSGSFPVGKVEWIDMYPLSFFEFLGALQENQALEFLDSWNVGDEMPLSLHHQLWDLLKTYFVVGGLPEAVQVFIEKKENLLLAFQEVRKRQEHLFKGYLADIAKHAGKTNSMHIERVLKAVPSQLAKSQDGSIKRFQFKGVVPKVDKYSRLAGAIDWLEAAHMILKVHITNRGELPFSAFIKESWFKLFIFDVGILGAMSNLPFQSIFNYDYGTYKGYFAENYLAQELLVAGCSSLYAWEEDRSKVEFLIEKEGELAPIEVKSGWVTKAQSLLKFRSKYHPPKSVIFSAKEPKVVNGTLHLPLYLAGKIYSYL